MNALQLIKTLIKPDPITLKTATAFIPGQIISGKIKALYPNQLAEVQVGSQKIMAQLEVPLSVNERYWFQVQQGEGKVHLKLLAQEDTGETKSKLPSEPLLTRFDLKPTKENIFLLEYAVRNKMPISKEMLQLGASWLKNLPEPEPGLETIKIMVEKALPYTDSVFTALLNAQDPEPIHSVMERLSAILKNDLSQSDSGRMLDNVLNKLLGKETAPDSNIAETGHVIDWENGEAVGYKMKQLIKTMGFTYENDLTQNGLEPPELDREPSLKPLLIRYLNENPGSEQKNVSEKLLHRITALQLLSNENGVIQQWVAQMPLAFPNGMKEATIQWNGRKQKDGQIDPNYCRVLFYLDLETIGETVVDVQIQNRIMSASIVNKRDDLKELSLALVPLLKEKLKKLNYHLSAVSFSEPSDQQAVTDIVKKVSAQSGQFDYQGVDFRI